MDWEPDSGRGSRFIARASGGETRRSGLWRPGARWQGRDGTTRMDRCNVRPGVLVLLYAAGDLELQH